MGVLVDGGYADNTGLSWTRRIITLIDRETVPPPAGSKHKWLDNTQVRVLHFSNDPSGACLDAGEAWQSTVPKSIRLLANKTKYLPVCSAELEELTAFVDPLPFQWLTGPLETLFFVRRGHAIREENEVSEVIGRREGQNSYFDFSLADALSSELCRLRDGRAARICEEYRNRRRSAGIPPAVPEEDVAKLLAAHRAVNERLAQQRADCVVRADQAQLPLGSVLRAATPN